MTNSTSDNEVKEMIFLIIIVFIGIILFELPTLIKNRYSSDIIVFLALIMIAFIISILFICNIPLPNPIRGISYLVKDLLHLNYK